MVCNLLPLARTRRVNHGRISVIRPRLRFYDAREHRAEIGRNQGRNFSVAVVHPPAQPFVTNDKPVLAGSRLQALVKSKMKEKKIMALIRIS